MIYLQVNNLLQSKASQQFLVVDLVKSIHLFVGWDGKFLVCSKLIEPICKLITLSWLFLFNQEQFNEFSIHKIYNYKVVYSCSVKKKVTERKITRWIQIVLIGWRAPISLVFKFHVTGSATVRLLLLLSCLCLNGSVFIAYWPSSVSLVCFQWMLAWLYDWFCLSIPISMGVVVQVVAEDNLRWTFQQHLNNIESE